MVFNSKRDLNILMKLESIQISNIWSFKYFERIAEAPLINFDENFNIIIGQNGAGKSTAMEVINFIFKRILFTPYSRNRDLQQQESSLQPGQRNAIIFEPVGSKQYSNFKLDRNFDFESYPQSIRLNVKLDDIDHANLQILQNASSQVQEIIRKYSTETVYPGIDVSGNYQIDIELLSSENTFRIGANSDSGFVYLTKYHLFQEAIDLFNEQNPNNRIPTLEEPFTLIGSYRNYQTFTPSVSLGGVGSADRQLDSHRLGESSRSASQSDGGEPVIFGLVRIRMAKHCLELLPTNFTLSEAEDAANNLAFVTAINDVIKVVFLKLQIKCTDYTTSNFSFSLIDTSRNSVIKDINILSAGQKAILHLVFEAFGRGNLNGGLVIIDEPEIHLHYQFQDEYIRVVQRLMEQQKTQYILVTHSESLIDSRTISSVIRFSLDANRYTQINQPSISTSDKWLVKILDLKRSNHAFFASKVLLVEGETDAFFFSAVLDHIEEKLHLGLTQEIAVLAMDGKDNKEWRPLFQSFGLDTYVVFDLDAAFNIFYPNEQRQKIDTVVKAANFHANHPNARQEIQNQYVNHTFILQEGPLELYLGTLHDLSSVITFCETRIAAFLSNVSDSKTNEIKMILEQVSGVPSTRF